MPISEATYERVALEDPDGQWELWCGQLRQKPTMTAEHNAVIYDLHRLLVTQLDPRDYLVSMDLGRVRIPGSFYVPDICVIPRAHQRRLLTQSPALEVYADPLPLIVEIWSASTGDYDLDTKLIEYQRRGDAEIWLIHPYEQTLTAYRRQPDGAYAEAHYRTGTITPSALPGVTIDLARLFA